MALVFGINPVIEALHAPEHRIERICVQRGIRSSRIRGIVERARERGVVLVFEDKSLLDRKCAGGRHQGVLCYVAESRIFESEEVLASASAPGLILLLDGIEDPRNLGAIIRSADVAGADGVLLPRRRSAGLTPTVMRTSAGALAHVKVGKFTNVSRAIGLLKEKGYWVAGLDMTAGTPLWEADFTGPSALILGGEGTGLHRLVRERCDFLVSIPVRGKVSSHNVSVAAGIALYEVVRQRLTRGRTAGLSEPAPVPSVTENQGRRS